MENSFFTRHDNGSVSVELAKTGLAREVREKEGQKYVFGITEDTILTIEDAAAIGLDVGSVLKKDTWLHVRNNSILRVFSKVNRQDRHDLTQCALALLDYSKHMLEEVGIVPEFTVRMGRSLQEFIPLPRKEEALSCWRYHTSNDIKSMEVQRFAVARFKDHRYVRLTTRDMTDKELQGTSLYSRGIVEKGTVLNILGSSSKGDFLITEETAHRYAGIGVTKEMIGQRMELVYVEPQGFDFLDGLRQMDATYGSSVDPGASKAAESTEPTIDGQVEIR